jgi:hypothetical protein
MTTASKRRQPSPDINRLCQDILKECTVLLQNWFCGHEMWWDSDLDRLVCAIKAFKKAKKGLRP